MDDTRQPTLLSLAYQVNSLFASIYLESNYIEPSIDRKVSPGTVPFCVHSAVSKTLNCA